MNKEYKDLSGERYGKWLVIKITERPKHVNNYDRYWLCQCDCGTQRIVNENSLIHGRSKSCGCSKKDLEINFGKKKKPFGEAAFHKLYCNYKRLARIKNRVFDLTEEEFKKLTKENCFYCGKEPYQIKHEKNLNGDYIYNGIDRIDSSKGYTSDNVVACCYFCNSAKSDTPQYEFLDWIKRVYNHSIVSQAI